MSNICIPGPVFLIWHVPILTSVRTSIKIQIFQHMIFIIYHVINENNEERILNKNLEWCLEQQVTPRVASQTFWGPCVVLLEHTTVCALPFSY